MPTTANRIWKPSDTAIWLRAARRSDMHRSGCERRPICEIIHNQERRKGHRTGRTSSSTMTNARSAGPGLQPLVAVTAGDCMEVPTHRIANRLLPCGENVAAEPGAIDLLELERLDRVPDPAHRRRIERNVVGIAVHDAHGSAVLADHDDIPGEQRALAVGAAGPVEHRT